MKRSGYNVSLEMLWELFRLAHCFNVSIVVKRHRENSNF